MKHLDQQGLATLLRTLAEGYDVYGPQTIQDRLVLRRLEFDDRAPELAWNEFRLAESLKPLFFQSGREIARWSRDGPRAAEDPRPRAVFGAKACDLKALAVLDKVLRDHEFQEPSYCAARERNLLISGDCTDCAASCFCTMLDDRPYPTEFYDLNLSPTDGGWLVDVGSPEGQVLVDSLPKLFTEADPALEAARDTKRRELTTRVEAQNEGYPTHDPFELSVEKNLKTRIWGDLASTCVSCNACNLVCPTCHCFLLVDVPTEEGAVRLSQWDSCFQAGHARMAGGGTPRLQLTERFKNHYFHKFVAFPHNWGITACSGCGRCVDACMGRIDKRECLHRLETEWIPSEVVGEID